MERLWRWLIGGCIWAGSMGSFGALYTVGPGGTHATLQTAIEAVQATAADDEIRLRGIDLSGGVNLVLSATSGSLTISGGWNADFTLASGSGLDPVNATVINANEERTNLRVLASAGVLEIRRLRLIFGRGAGGDNGGNLSAQLTGSAQLRLDDVHFLQGLATNVGAGGYISAAGTSRFEARNCSIQGNRINAASGSHFGTGLAINAADSANIVLARLSIFANEGLGGVAGFGSGLDLLARNDAVIDVVDSLIASNRSTSTDSASALSVLALNGALINLARIRIQANDAIAADRRQVLLDRRDLSVIFMNDSLISDSNSAALFAIAYPGAGGLVLNNLTMARNASPGQLLDLGSMLTLNNSIVHANGTATLSAMGTNNLGSNLGFSAPIFEDLSTYRLAVGSPGIDQGSAAVPGGLGTFDIDLNPRVLGLAVDIGATEFVPNVLFQSSFE